MAWDQEVDVLVVGSGAGGMTAAVTAADLGAEVLVIEKGARFGGTSASSGGVLWIPGSHLAEAAGRGNTVELAYTYVRGLAGSDCPEARLRALLENGPKMLKYLEDRTEVKYVSTYYPDYQPQAEGGLMMGRTHDAVPIDGALLGEDLEFLEPPHPANMLFGRYVWNTADAAKLITRSPGWVGAMWRTLWRYYSDVGQRLKSKRSRYLTGGNALVARLKLSMDARKIPLWRNTKLLELVVEDGRVAGAIVEREGKKLRIGARRAVILAAGGFERNAALREKHMPASANPAWSGSQSNNTGDALLAAQAVGADIAMMDSAWRAPAIVVPGEDRSRPNFLERSLPGAIIVNQAGRRYFNESLDYHLAGQAMIDNDRADAGTSPSYLLFDALFKWRYPMGPVMPILPVWIFPKAVREVLIRANSIPELGAKLGLDPAALSETVARFNANAREGKDPDFHRGDTAYERLFGDPKLKPNPNLMPLEKPPFYAVAIYPGDIGTNGGLLADANAVVQDTDGRPIAGLYAAGNVAASPVGRSYPGGGATLGAAMTFAYLAARHAMGANDGVELR